MGQNGGNIGGDEIFSVAMAENQRRTLAGGDDFTGFVGAYDGDTIGTLDLNQGLPDGFGEVAVIMFFDEMDENFGVGIGDDTMSFFLQEGFQGAVVFDDAVMHEGDSYCSRNEDGHSDRSVRRGWPSGYAKCPERNCTVFPRGFFPDGLFFRRI